MKYILIDTKGCDTFTKEFDSKEEAIKTGDQDFAYLTKNDKKNREFYLLESVNPDEDAENHFDGDVIKTWL